MDEHIEVVEGDIAVVEKDIGLKKDRFLPVSILIAAIIIAGSVVFSTFYRTGSAPAAGGAGAAGAAGVTAGGDTTGGAQGAQAAQTMKIGPDEEILGAKGAPVTIVEYGDYQCPFCTRFFTDTEPLIAKNYIDTGKVRMVFRNFPFLGPESTAAALAAGCAADQGKLWRYHDALYRAKANDEAKGGGENDGSLNRTLFLSIARQLGLNIPAFTSCVDGNTHADKVAQDKAAAAAAGVNSTPNFFVNGKQILGAQPYGVFQSAIEAAFGG